MSLMKRYVFFISDGTGITAQSLGVSLLTQFETIDFVRQSVPYIDTLEKADEIVEKINRLYNKTKQKPIVFITLVNPEIRETIIKANACFLDLFTTFLSPLEQELQTKSSYTVGRTHSLHNPEKYDKRIEAINFALSHDDGLKIQGYEQADIILIGVSRSGKTPSCLYMALQFGILAANYPLTEEELCNIKLPEILKPYKRKLFGLTIDSQRLQQIRSERRPDSRYASKEQCTFEIAAVENMFMMENIPFINSTKYSIEEISTKIMAAAGIKRKVL